MTTSTKHLSALQCWCLFLPCILSLFCSRNYLCFEAEILQFCNFKCDKPFLMDVLTILGDINKAFQEKTAVISSVLFEIKSAVRNLERRRYRYIYICSMTKNVRSHVHAVLFFAT
jgi:hypothetical protein